ncbi:DUF4920 domain-containing protein [Flavobacterium sp. KACC 22763]|uniref:DUF4920 domain-containing protein n=1 Tax=Flavobacterium sp. KACC 22763 TaxID=3025668 RepID=UPI00236553E3|nr:DUF4920 domain-containing protein [Flavobacterium sp. KACC 22763]WDF64119.1 DUF4920 domain-containing protein [Flavobacterium sp. KACC 22763]
MKKGFYSMILFVCFSALSFAQDAVEKAAPPKGEALVGDYYGENISNALVAKAITVEELGQDLKVVNKLENVAVKGEVLDVCPKRGCWVSVKTEDGTSFFVKMKDYAFFVPTALKGKNVILEGSVERKVTSVEELKHYAKDAKKTKSEIEAIKAPKEEIRFLASGIKVVN